MKGKVKRFSDKLYIVKCKLLDKFPKLNKCIKRGNPREVILNRWRIISRRIGHFRALREGGYLKNNVEDFIMSSLETNPLPKRFFKGYEDLNIDEFEPKIEEDLAVKRR